MYLNDPASGALSEMVHAAGFEWHDYLQVDGKLVAMRNCVGGYPSCSGS